MMVKKTQAATATKVHKEDAAPAKAHKEDEAPEKAPAKAKKEDVRRFVGKKFPYYHPFQAKNIPVGGDGVTLEMDNWLECQIEAGLIIEV
jgi:hypothetical protein